MTEAISYRPQRIPGPAQATSQPDRIPDTSGRQLQHSASSQPGGGDGEQHQYVVPGKPQPRIANTNGSYVLDDSPRRAPRAVMLWSEAALTWAWSLVAFPAGRGLL
jgi:hypothetical protein